MADRVVLGEVGLDQPVFVAPLRQLEIPVDDFLGRFALFRVLQRVRDVEDPKVHEVAFLLPLFSTNLQG